jgi:hypothetical protein
MVQSYISLIIQIVLILQHSAELYHQTIYQLIIKKDVWFILNYVTNPDFRRLIEKILFIRFKINKFKTIGFISK